VIRSFVLVIDQPQSFAWDHPDAVVSDGLLLVQHLDVVLPGETVTIPLVLWAGTAADHVFRFFVAVVGVRCAFAVRKLTAISPGTFEFQRVPNCNDTGNVTYHCTVVSRVDGLEVIGMINRRGRFLQTVALPQGNSLSPGQSLSFVAFTGDEIGKQLESWRAALLGRASLALLLKIPDIDRPLQRNLGVDEPTERPRLVLSMQNRVEVPLGTVLSCGLELRDNVPDGFVLFVEPLPFRLCELGAGQGDRYLGCRWVGVTKRRLSRENGYKVRFSFVASGGGMFEVPGFHVSRTPRFSLRSKVVLSQAIQIVPCTTLQGVQGES
jgi:hypothetical protein